MPCFFQQQGGKSNADAEDAAKEKEEAYIESLESVTMNLASVGNRERRKSKHNFLSVLFHSSTCSLFMGCKN